ncbi:MAG: cyclic nucleotide-binding domain-containing protein [Thermodesulfobacteriota bacterium]
MIDPELLREQQFFADLTDEEVAVVAGVTQKASYNLGDTIFKESEDGQSIYIIKSGEVKACKTAPDGELFTLTIMREGEIFGEMSFLDGRPHTSTIVAIADLKVYVINRKDFETIIEGHPWIVYKLMKNIVFTIHAIVRGMNSRYMEMINYMWGRKRFN